MPEDSVAAINAEQLLSYMLLDICVKGEYPKYVWNYLVERNIQPEVLEGDKEILKSSKPDFIGCNYYFSICVKAPGKEKI